MKKIIWSGFLVASALSTAYITPILADEVNNITKNEVENIDTETQEKIVICQTNLQLMAKLNM